MAPATDRTADVIVVGLGAAGAATLYQLARRGVKAIGLDRFAPPHDRGSSHGETRITRHGVGEGEVYAPLAIRSHEIWRELEADTGAELLDACGLLTLAPANGRGQMHGASDFLGRAAAVARAFAVPHEILAPGEIAARWPQFRLAGDERGLFEPGAGLLYPERCIAAQIAEARRLGARAATDCPALKVEETPTGVRVITAHAIFEGATAVVTAGAWTPGLLGGPLARLVLQPQALHWFACEEPAAFAPGRFPVFIWMHGECAGDAFYGFPALGGAEGGVKVARELCESIATPDDLDRRAPPGAAAEVFERHLSGRLPGVGPRVLRSAVCVYTTAPDSDFVIGWTGERVLVASACSGHGFKHSAAVGELLAAAVTHGRALPPQFDPRRLETAEGAAERSRVRAWPRASTPRGASAK